MPSPECVGSDAHNEYKENDSNVYCDNFEVSKCSTLSIMR